MKLKKMNENKSKLEQQVRELMKKRKILMEQITVPDNDIKTLENAVNAGTDNDE